MKHKTVVRKLAALTIRLYQLTISPMKIYIFGANCGCRFYPSCSAYGRECIKEHGLWRGCYLTLWRILRCQPLCAGGYDPVPPKKYRK